MRIDRHYLPTACKHRSGPTLCANKESERNPNRQQAVLQFLRPGWSQVALQE
jgi:hypothetical protein